MRENNTSLICDVGADEKTRFSVYTEWCSPDDGVSRITFKQNRWRLAVMADEPWVWEKENNQKVDKSMKMQPIWTS